MLLYLKVVTFASLFEGPGHCFCMLQAFLDSLEEVIAKCGAAAAAPGVQEFCLPVPCPSTSNNNTNHYNIAGIPSTSCSRSSSPSPEACYSHDPPSGSCSNPAGSSSSSHDGGKKSGSSGISSSSSGSSKGLPGLRHVLLTSGTDIPLRLVDDDQVLPAGVTLFGSYDYDDDLVKKLQGLMYKALCPM